MNPDDAKNKRTGWPLLCLLTPLILLGCEKEKDAERFKQTGTASWYGAELRNQKTANGDLFDLSNLAISKS